MLQPEVSTLRAMAIFSLLFAATACASVSLESRRDYAASAPELAEQQATHRQAGLDETRFQPEDFWDLLLPILARQPERFRVSQIGESVEGRPLRRIDFGAGTIPVLLWSQMHGNESTASRALVDVFAYLADRPDDPRVRRIGEQLAVTVIPVLNPDGAARFVRHNAVGIDINRDARMLATPEGRALKSVRDDTEALWGFNLHDQNIRTRLGSTAGGVRISLLAPPPGDGITSEPNRNAKLLASVIAVSLRPLVGSAIARYSESFNPRAFGDLITMWGTGVVLIESGGSLDDPSKELLRTANFVAILTSLESIATGSWSLADRAVYEGLPANGRGIGDLVFLGGSIVLPGSGPVQADFAVRFEDPLARIDGTISEVGDLADVEALEILDISGLYYVPDASVLSHEHGPYLRIGDSADGVIARDLEGRQVVWRLEEGRPVLVERR